MTVIIDPDDPRVEPYRAVRERDLAGRHGLFLAEGEVVVRTLLSRRSRFEVVSILLSEPRRTALADVLADRARDVPVYVAGRAVLDAIVGFPIHRGVLALGRRDPGIDEGATLAPSGPALVLGLLGLANHDNVGGAFRNAAAFGADAVILDGGCCDPLYRKAIRVSVGAALTVPFARGGRPEEVVEGLASSGFEVFALSPAGAEPIERIAWPERRALLVGQEGQGLPDRLLSRLRTVRIDMVPGFDSLNVATAAGIALHAARSPPTPAFSVPDRTDGSD